MASLEDETFREVKSRLVDTMQKTEWIPLSLTLVEYPQGDFFGKLLALISLIPFAIIAGIITLILFRRDLHTITFFSGMIINDIINFILKHTICEARPMRRNVHVEYGMPSSHAQFMWFFAAYTTLFICIRLHHNNNSSVSERFWRVTSIAACIIIALLVTYSRVYLLYHSISQVLCGAFIGIILGVVWFLIMHIVLTPFFPIIVSWRISEYLLLRDTTLIPNILWFEYTNIRTEARARSRKLVSMKSQ
ncbi:PREDICTED: dolichyldiphosphatase 1-like [Dufourea novaeangliae]|uniref:Dolichyldiphosphatase n=1 Tax=Dufourea novaeangliae TaxID=178035 RepID=A0A154PJ09_DUFNO|nr:PREDICTED: dolichyldiphosphatase 1-like [Dufourea novaeangliae]KZC11839.1 Dolichyldiphosphatase 1 [Dufourea novaeangliae]